MFARGVCLPSLWLLWLPELLVWECRWTGQLWDFLGNSVVGMAADFSCCQEGGIGMCTNKASLLGSVLWMKPIDQEIKLNCVIIWGLYRGSHKHQEFCPLYFSRFHLQELPRVHNKFQIRTQISKPSTWLLTSALGPSSKLSPTKILGSAFSLSCEGTRI